VKYKFYTCDVFTNARYSGNPLAVLPHASGLSTEQMQAIAKEFNYSESTFVFPGGEEFNRQVRIFTPTQEVPFAGHPNIGTANTLAQVGLLGEFEDEIEIVFSEKAGPVPIRIKNLCDSFWSELQAPEKLSLGKTIDVELAAGALSLSLTDIKVDSHQPQIASVGLPFICIELKDLSAIQRAKPNIKKFEEIHALGVMPDIHVYIHSNDEFNLRTRMFAPLDNIPEDPATGSANCALVGLLTHLNDKKDGQFTWRIGQGIEMGRPSVLDARTEKNDGQVTGVWIAGDSILVSEGYIFID